ncbi:MAG: hypothetical protein PHP93_06930 [Kiritimatiellales bacterium]|nr:hypothetical protein [Kiritimatiellales bacterium]
MSEETRSSSRPDEDILLDLNFVPQWAKKAPAANHYAFDDRTERRPSYDRRDGGARRERSDRRDGPARTSRPPRSSDDRRSSPGGAPMPPRAQSAVRSPQEPRREFTPRPERIELPVEIKFLPEQQWLASMVRQIHHSKRAYPLMDLASLFLSDPKGHLVKIEIMPGAKEFKLYQGKRSKMVATSRDALVHQLLDDHLEDFFTKEDITVDPPTGVFPMIGKIGDLLIGPPNHHSYAARLQEIYNARFSGMSFDRFKEKVQTVRDEELVAKWKEESSKKTVYRLKDAPEGNVKDFTLAQAEEYVRTNIAEAEIEEVTRAVLPSSLARKIKDYNLIRMVREAWERESRFPLSVSFALRAAFRHLHLETFKAGKNINFITSVKPDPVQPEKTAEHIRLVLEYLAGHPGSTREQLVEGLRPGVEKDSDSVREILTPLRWLIEKGHIIEFFNGTLSVPSHRSRR